MKQLKETRKALQNFIILWSTQSLSVLGSSMTNFAFVLWSYEEKGSALTTALLSVCTYAPYVIMSIFAGAFSDKWNKKIIMLVSDSFAAACTVGVLFLLESGRLEIYHLYFLNGLNGLMNTVQQPASDVAVTLLTPREHDQKVSGMRSFSGSLTNILSPIFATAVFAAAGLPAVILIDLGTFAVAFLSLAFLVKIPDVGAENKENVSVLAAAKDGIGYLKENLGILYLILFLAAINLTASMYQAAFPAMLLSRSGGGKETLAVVNAVTGLAMVTGSIVASVLPKPKSRVRVICNTLLLAMSTENFILAFGSTAWVWCIGAVLGWVWIPIFNANMDVLFRSYIPVNMQGRVYSARNTLQFFTIPIGYFLGGFLVDHVFEPFMSGQPAAGVWHTLFGVGKGSGAAFFFFVIGCVGVITCLIFRRNQHIWQLETQNSEKV